MTKLRYSSFVHSIDVDAFEAAIGFTPIRQDRGNDVGHCLWPKNHKSGDSTGKFAIERDLKVFNCFVCGGGSLLSLVMELNHLDIDEATKWIYQFAHGEHQTDSEFADDLLAQLDDIEEKIRPLPYFNPRVLDKYDGGLRDYFYDRGYDDTVIDDFGLRYVNELERRCPRPGSDEVYIGPASIWPHYWQEKLVGWQTRWTDYPDVPKWVPKWTNTTDFPKQETLFSYDRCLGKEAPIVICESLGTVVFCWTHSVPAVAYFGSKLTDKQLRLLRHFSQGVILAPDNDSNRAGDKILNSVQYLERYIPVYLADKVEGPDGADLNDLGTGEALHHHLREHVQRVDSLDF